MIYINDDIDSLYIDSALLEMSEQRRDKVLSFKHELERKQSAAAYLLLKQALSQEYGITDNPVFDYAEGGKPMLRDYPQIHFNLSHCKTGAVCAVSDKPIGIDIESIRKFNPELACYVLNDAECDAVIGAERRDVAFIKLWTMKESLLKLTGEGLRTDLKTVLLSTDARFTTVVGRTYIYTVCVP